MHSFPDFALLSSFASQTKASASVFALSTEVHHAAANADFPRAVPEIHTTLAVACKRRLLLLSWVDGTWNPQTEVSLPHQIRGMAFDGRRLVAGFSTGEYGVVTLPALDGEGAGQAPTLGDLFSLPLPLAERPSRTSVPGLGGLGGLGNVVSLGTLNALSRKLEKNGVVRVPRPTRRQRPGPSEAKLESDWLWAEEWGWQQEKPDEAGEVLVVRDSALSSHSKCGPLLIRLRRHRPAAFFNRQAPPSRSPVSLRTEYLLPFSRRRSTRLPALHRLTRRAYLGRPRCNLSSRHPPLLARGACARHPRTRPNALPTAERVFPTGLYRRIHPLGRETLLVDSQARRSRPSPHRFGFDTQSAPPRSHQHGLGNRYAGDDSSCIGADPLGRDGGQLAVAT